MKIKLTDLEIQSLLEMLAADVEFLIVGGAAVAAHGCRRKHNDLDLLFRPSPDNLDKLIGVRIGTHVMSSSDVDKFKDQCGAIQSIPGFDLLKETLATPIEEVFDKRCCKLIDHSQLWLPVISIDHLIAEKRISDSGADRDDIEALLPLLSATEGH